MMVSSGRPSPNQIIFLLGEFLLILLAALLALYLRLGDTEEIFTWKYSWHRLFVVPVIMEITFYYCDLHNFRFARPFIWTVTRSAQAVAIGIMVLAVIYYIVPRLFLGRGVLVMCFFTVWLTVLIWRRMYQWALRQEIFSSRIMVVASGSLADSIFDELCSRSDNVFKVACILDVTSPSKGGEGDDSPLNLMESWAHLLRAEVRTDAAQLMGLVRYYQVDLVVVAMDEMRGRMPMEELLRCRMLGVPVMTGEDFFETFAGRILADRIKASWLIFRPGFTTSALRRYSKRAFDVFFSALGLLLASPLTLLTALAIRLDSKGSILYRQERVGQYGRKFTILKFRSMVEEAEKDTGPVWAAEKDPRVTRVGRFIRKTRLDEIPQMWTVLKGDMSFVGPRPERDFFVEQLKRQVPFYNERHNVKPGITGWAQVCFPYGSSAAAALEKLNYDLYYIKHSSFSMDITILFQTVKTLLFGGGGR